MTFSFTFGPVSTLTTGLFIGFVCGVIVTLIDFRKKIFKKKDL